MGKIARFTGNLLAFALSATGTKRTVFGDTAQSDTLDDNLNADALVGWENGVDINGFPPIQYFNAIGFMATQLAAYLHQYGIAEWDNAQEYYIGGLTNVAGVIYHSLVDSNVNFDPTSEPTKWAKIEAGTLEGNDGAHYLARANHTGIQAIATLSDHNKAAHDALNIDAAELGGSAAALYALLVSPAFTGNPTAPTQAPSDNSTKIATTAYADAAVGAAGSVGQTELKTAIGSVNVAGSAAQVTLPGGEYGFYPQVKTNISGTGDAQIANSMTNTSYATIIYLNAIGVSIDAQQRYIQSSPPYKIGNVGWGHFIYLLRNKTTNEIVASYEAQDPPWAYNGPNWLHKDDPELLALIPHPFPDFGTALFPESDFEVVLIDLRDFDVNLWQYDNMGLGKTIMSDMKEFASVGKIKTRQQVGLPEIIGFTDKIKIRSRN